ncbi:hypothetical protein VNI00_002129 [Paramarasmius palmivorus]|uniref:Uncharacterized protein n=1 Tax=Paramarasmius palmivorus TaxID=297713 RepID=A0AAW0E4B3_9AGAR
MENPFRTRCMVIYWNFPGSWTSLEGPSSNANHSARPGLYSQQFRHRALRIVLTQIAWRDTAQLLQRCSRWPAKDLEGVLMEFAACLDTQWQDVPSAAPMYPDIAQVYTNETHSSNSGSHPILPFLDFLLGIAQLDAIAQVNAEYLECIFTPSSLFKALATSLHHPLSSQPTELPLSAVTITYDKYLRRNVWRDLGVRNVARRLENMYHDLKSTPEENGLLDACIDALDFTCSSDDLRVKNLALKFIAQVPACSQYPHASDTLAQAISLLSDADKVRVLSDLMQGIELDVIDGLEIESSLYARFIELFLKAAAECHNTQTFISAGIQEFFLFAVSRQLNANHGQALRDYTTLEIVRSVVNDVLPMSLVQVPDESKALWKNVIEVFGWPDDDEWQTKSLLHTPELSLTAVETVLIDMIPEDTFSLEISVQLPSSPRSWEVRKTLPELKELYSRILRKAKSHLPDEMIPESPVWELCSSLQPRDKEVFVGEFLHGLTRLPLRDQRREFTMFLSTDVVYGPHPEKPAQSKFDAHVVVTTTIEEEVGLLEIRDDPAMPPEGDEFEEAFLREGGKLGLL